MNLVSFQKLWLSELHPLFILSNLQEAASSGFLLKRSYLEHKHMISYPLLIWRDFMKLVYLLVLQPWPYHLLCFFDDLLAQHSLPRSPKTVYIISITLKYVDLLVGNCTHLKVAEAETYFLRDPTSKEIFEPFVFNQWLGYNITVLMDFNFYHPKLLFWLEKTKIVKYTWKARYISSQLRKDELLNLPKQRVILNSTTTASIHVFFFKVADVSCEPNKVKSNCNFYHFIPKKYNLRDTLEHCFSNLTI